ncbi:hypothetical protein JZ751_008118, partial [Albula glossodonta]
MTTKMSSLTICCSVCLEIFTDSVRMPCSHIFCRVCLSQGCGERSPRECPVCKRLSIEDTSLNLDLRNIAESYFKQRVEAESTGKSDVCCSFHGEKLQFFCVEIQEPLCAVCHSSNNHRDHKHCPVEKAAMDLKNELKTALNPMQEKLDRFIEVKYEFEKTAEHIKSQAEHSEKQVRTQFEKLHQFLRDEEEARLAALREEEEQKSQMMEEKIKKITKHIATLSDKITVIENCIDMKNVSFLKAYKDTVLRAQCKLQEPVLPAGALIDVGKHVGNLKFKVWKKMIEMLQYTPVTLDPNTAA